MQPSADGACLRRIRVGTYALATLEPDRPWHGDSCEVPVRTLDELLAGERQISFFADAGYDGWFIIENELRPLERFDVTRDQLAFLDGRFMPYQMPARYVSYFLFCPPETRLPSGLARPAH